MGEIRDKVIAVLRNIESDDGSCKWAADAILDIPEIREALAVTEAMKSAVEIDGVKVGLLPTNAFGKPA